jgi:hypothetical protein
MCWRQSAIASRGCGMDSSGSVIIGTSGSHATGKRRTPPAVVQGGQFGLRRVDTFFFGRNSRPNVPRNCKVNTILTPIEIGSRPGASLFYQTKAGDEPCVPRSVGPDGGFSK